MRKPGWYHVKDENGFWQCAQWNGHGWHGIYAVEAKDGAWLEIGPRIPTPDEPWKCVPVEPTREMLEATGDKSADAYAGMLGAWTLMLKAAPKPETQP